MGSWRDEASPQAQSDMDQLLDEGLSLTRDMLAKRGEFYPWGIGINNEGQIEMLAATTGDEHPASTELLDLLLRGTLAKATRFRAAAFVSDVRLTSGGDAVRVEIEHREGLALTVFLPYSKKRFGTGVDYGEITGELGNRRVWAPMEEAQ